MNEQAAADLQVFKINLRICGYS